MALEDYAQLKGVRNMGEDGLSNILEANLKMFFDFAFLASAGAWRDVNIPTSGTYGGDFSTLRRVNDPAYTNGQIWETVRKDWIWESGVEYSYNGTDYEPIQISGVWVDDVFYEPDDATYGHHFNYPLGRVVFDTAIPTTSTVKVNYSYRFIQIYRSNNSWYRELQYNSFRPDHSHVSQVTSGVLSVGSNHRVQLPAIVIETSPRRKSTGYEMGNSALTHTQDMNVYIYAENSFDRNNIFDAICEQSEKDIWLYDPNAVSAGEDFPLNSNGHKVKNINYPDLVSESGYRWKKCRLHNIQGFELANLNPYLWTAQIRVGTETIIGTV